MLMSMPALSTKLIQGLEKSLFPPACPLCSKPLENSTQGCCPTCLQNIKVMPKNTCLSCGIPLDATLAPGPCGQCLKKTPPQQETHHLYQYKSPVREAILAWKLHGDDSALIWLLDAAEQQLQTIFSKDDLLLPVPMPLYRMQRSGLHHSADLCQNIAAQIGCTMDWKILRRKGNDKRQSSLQGKARERNLRHSFTLAEDGIGRAQSHNIKGKVWVVDDILTTGATLRHACAAARQIKRPIFAFSFARVLHDE